MIHQVFDGIGEHPERSLLKKHLLPTPPPGKYIN